MLVLNVYYLRACKGADVLQSLRSSRVAMTTCVSAHGGRPEWYAGLRLPSIIVRRVGINRVSACCAGRLSILPCIAVTACLELLLDLGQLGAGHLELLNARFGGLLISLESLVALVELRLQRLEPLHQARCRSEQVLIFKLR